MYSKFQYTKPESTSSTNSNSILSTFHYLSGLVVKPINVSNYKQHIGGNTHVKIKTINKKTAISDNIFSPLLLSVQEKKNIPNTKKNKKIKNQNKTKKRTKKINKTIKSTKL